MNTFLFLMCSIAILCAPLCGANDVGNATSAFSTGSPESSPANQTSNPSSMSGTISTAKVLLTSPVSKSQSLPSSATPKPNTVPNALSFKKECLYVYMVTGGLIILSFFLLLSTLLLACRVCHLNKRIKELSSNADLISISEYRIGTAKTDKSEPEKEPEETTVLMSDLSQNKEEMGNGTTKEEGENGQTGQDSKTEDGDKNKSEEAAATPAAVAESSSPSKGPEETNESPSAEATAASKSEGTGEPKDVV
ncbi:uncharacterized protein LOC117812578 [Notolabrus celidotus]|uniref:uncharacterized protein LOC117812578 n=1 Tax=Notolabrus celidotus TaxID=1203425 RepID=UPI00148F54B6|nr:uncharacterized protein LOC117812578 [Notolabrus celidotus]